jgi:hypothetical protein
MAIGVQSQNTSEAGAKPPFNLILSTRIMHFIKSTLFPTHVARAVSVNAQNSGIDRPLVTLAPFKSSGCQIERFLPGVSENSHGRAILHSIKKIFVTIGDEIVQMKEARMMAFRVF